MSTIRDRHGQQARHVGRAAFWKSYRVLRGALKRSAEPAENLKFLRAWRDGGFFSVGASLFAMVLASETFSKEALQ